jgi:enoyl-CoA hydratase/carnithine racemase
MTNPQGGIPVSDFETLRYDIHDGLATISLNRPDKRNAMNAQMFTDLGDAAERASTDPGVRVILVRGEGSSFCAGIDVNLMSQLAGSRGARFRTWVRGAQKGFHALATADKPTVAAVKGHAVGAGFQVALACDLRIVADDMTMGMFEIKFSLVPDLGGNHRLTRLVGPARAKELVWTGRPLDAAEAERVGLANRVVSVDTLDKEAEAFARELLASPPIPVSLAKSLIDRSFDQTLEAEFEQAAQAQTMCVETEDHREAVAAFLEKRPPRFQGR